MGPLVKEKAKNQKKTEEFPRQAFAYPGWCGFSDEDLKPLGSGL
jgi:hypothetical protein